MDVNRTTKGVLAELMKFRRSFERMDFFDRIVKEM
jgi:hypothetical protein